MRARSKMFVNALHAASSSTAEEPTSKMRIIEKTWVTFLFYIIDLESPQALVAVSKTESFVCD